MCAEFNMKLFTISILIILTFSHARSDWSNLGSGMNGQVYALTVYNGELIAGGHFTTAGGISANNIAKWNGSTWTPLGDGVNSDINALTVYQGELIAGGWLTTAGGVSVNRIAKWNGTSWTSLGDGVDWQVRTLAVYNGELIAGGIFSKAGGVSVGHIARWNGTSWNDIGGGVGGTPYIGLDEQVNTLTVYNNELIAGGWFYTAGGVRASRIAKWNGTAWAPCGGGIDEILSALTVYNGQLIAGGSFSSAGGISSKNLAQWNGSSWSPLSINVGGSGQYLTVDALAVYNSELLVGGSFTVAGGLSAKNIARWNGNSWSPLGVGVGNLRGLEQPESSRVLALCVYNGVLIAGGRFTDAGNVNANYIAEWNNLVDVDMSGKQRPLQCELSQNYPNPFNPTTTIHFSLAVKGYTSLKVFDMFGREVTILVNEELMPGEYERLFHGDGLASGIYFYSLRTKNFSQTKRLVLVK
jgi:hypothetical protein